MLVDEHSPAGPVWFVDILARILTRARSRPLLLSPATQSSCETVHFGCLELDLAFLTWTYSLRAAIERSHPLPSVQSASMPQLRGLPKDSPDVRLSKTLAYLLRHGAEKEGLPMRRDGYVKVHDLVRPDVRRMPILSLTSSSSSWLTILCAT